MKATIKLPKWHDIELHRPKRLECAAGRTKGMTMSDVPSPKLPARVRGRPFEKGRSGNPAGRRPGSRNKATLAAAALLAGEAEALTRTAVEFALAGDRLHCDSALNGFCRRAANGPSGSPYRR